MTTSAPGQPVPGVSIGLPVYNGQAYLDAALASLLGQDFDDFEVIVSDNASTDATPAICAAWAARDPRVRVYRNDTNIGLEQNFNRTLGLARGRYFRWAAGDDLVAPDHLRECVGLLDTTPDAVICQSWVHVIDGNGDVIGLYDGGLAAAESHDAAERFAAVVLTRHLCTHVFGVMRTEALRATRLLDSYFGSDRAMLAELVLLGRFVHVPRPLFMNREHPGRGSRSRRHEPGTRRGLPSLLLYADYWQAVTRHAPDARTRARCRLHLLQWWLRDWNAARVVVDAVASVYPPIEAYVQRLKVRLYGPLPQVRRVAAPAESGHTTADDQSGAVAGEPVATKSRTA